MKVDCEKMINNLNNSGDYFRSYLKKIVILRVVKQIFCDMLIGGFFWFTLTHFLKSQISEKMCKMINPSLRITSQNDVQGTL